MKHSAYIAIKWLSRISLVLFLMSNVLYWSAWRTGIVKFACGQPTTQSMRVHYEIMASPFLSPALTLAWAISSILVIWMVAELKFRDKLQAKTIFAWRKMRNLGCLTLPTFGAYLYLIFGNTLNFWTGLLLSSTTILVCVAILIQHENKTTEFLE